MSKPLAERLKRLASVIESGADIPGPMVNNLVETLENIIAKDIICVSLIALGNEGYLDDNLVAPNPPPPVLFELVGRLQAQAQKISIVASQSDAAEDQDHTGHGCPHDPMLRSSDPSRPN